MPDTQSDPCIHLVNPLWDPCGGGDRRTIATYENLRIAAPTTLWSPASPADCFSRNYPIRRIRALPGCWPRGGTLVIMGVYFRIGHWIRWSAPQRIVVLYNTDQPDRLEKTLSRARTSGITDISLVFTSRELRARSNHEGEVLESLIDLRPFMDLPLDRHAGLPFTVGRLSRDTLKKHHSEDVALYRQLAAAGVRVRIMGGTCLAGALANTPNIELLPAGAESPEQFLASLDCFFYRTRDDWFEAFGRVVFEAMAAGLPVVASSRGGYANYLNNGQDSLVFSSTAEALAHLNALKQDRSKCRALARNARNAAENLMTRIVPAKTRRLLGAISPGIQPEFLV